MIRRLFTILAIVGSVCLLAPAQSNEPLGLQDFVLSLSRPSGMGEVTPALDGATYFRMSDDGDKIVRYSFKTGEAVATVFDAATARDCSIDCWDGYKMSADESKILLWNERQPIYRHSFRADYYVYEVRHNKLTKLSEGGGEEIATISPDGRMVAYVKANNIYIKKLDYDSEVAVTTDGVVNSIINGVPDWVYQEEFGVLNTLTWSPDNLTLAFVRFDESEVPMYSMTLYEGACHANSQYALYPGSYDYKYPVAGEKNSVVSVWAYDVENRTLKAMQVPKTDDDYIPRIEFSRESDKLMVTKINRSQNDMRIYAVNPRSTVAREVYHETSKSWVDAYTPRSVRYYDGFFTIVSDKSGYAQLYQYSMSGTLMKQLTDGNEDVTAFYGYDPKRATFYYQTTSGPLRRVVKSVTAAGKTATLEAAEGTNSALFSNDFSYYISTFSNASTPTQYRVKGIAGKTVRDLELNTDYARRYTSSQVPKREFVTFNNDGYTLNGYIIKPVDFDPSKRYPVIMQQYCGPGSQEVLDSWSANWQTYFAMQGFVIACFDGRGTGGRGKEFESLVYKNLGHYETIDQVAAARYMASQPWVDAERIGIWGWSYGGYEVLMAMSAPNAPYAAGVSIAPVTSWRFYDTIYAERFMLTPNENPNGYRDSAPLNRVAGLRGDLLIMFGSADDNVHIINAMQYIAMLHDQGTQFDMMVYPNMNHSINGCGVRLPLYQKVLDFFNEKLKR